MNRKQFIRNTALAATGFFIVPRHVLGRGFVAPSDKLRIAGIGVGGKGETDLKYFYESGKAEITHLCDVDTIRAANSVKRFPKARFIMDWREMLDKYANEFDAVSVSGPDHNHAVQTLAAMQLGKHVYVQKPLTHDIYEARMLTEAARRYQVVTQMGNQGASGDGVRQMIDWYKAGLIGKVHTVYAWTDRPVWPQGISWPPPANKVPSTLNWDLWLGTAPEKSYVENLVPFNWRGWWDYGTGALGDMGCHLIEPAFRVLDLDYITEVEASVGSVYVGEFRRGYFPESCPPSSHVTMRFPANKNTDGPLTLHWMDGGIQPTRPEELAADDMFGDGGNGCYLIGTKGAMMCSTYGANPRLIGVNAPETVPETIQKVDKGAEGHYAQWVEASIAGKGKKELSSPFEIAGPLTEALLMANLAIRAQDIRYERADGKGFTYPGRYRKLNWNPQQMKVTNLDEVNQFVKRKYRDGYSLSM